MNKIYEKYDDCHVIGTRVYVKANDNYAYADSTLKEKIDAETLKDLFVKGLIIVDGGNLYKAVSCKTASNVTTITYVKTNATTVTTADLATLRSK